MSSSNPAALPTITHELTVVADGVPVVGRDILVLLPSQELTVVVAFLGKITQAILQPEGRIHIGIQGLVDGRPINFITYKKGDNHCRTAADVPCAVVIGAMATSVEDELPQWQFRNPDLRVIDARPQA